MPRPPAITPTRWQQILDDARVFLGHWGAQAARLGWDAVSVFGCHAARPDDALDCQGLVPLMHGDEIVAISADAARLRTASGAIQNVRRHPAPVDARLLWALTE